MPVDPPPTRLEMVAATMANAMQDAAKALNMLRAVFDDAVRTELENRRHRLAVQRERFDAIRAEARRVR
jgi:BMFP domain-containing protein YqiC